MPGNPGFNSVFRILLVTASRIVSDESPDGTDASSLGSRSATRPGVKATSSAIPSTGSRSLRIQNAIAALMMKIRMAVSIQCHSQVRAGSKDSTQVFASVATIPATLNARTPAKASRFSCAKRIAELPLEIGKT